MDGIAQKAKQIIEKILYITIATVSPDGQPWNSPVYSAYDEQYNFYWASWEENQHSQNIEKNNRVFLAIYDSTVPEGTGDGVYIHAKAYKLEDKAEIERGLSYLYRRKGKAAPAAEQFLGDYPRRVYKAIPEKMWMNGEGDVNGNYIDIRQPIELPLKA